MFTPYTFSRGLLRPKHLGLFRSGQQQTDYMEKVLGYSPVAYWMLSESAGPTADNAEGTSARDGTYSGSGITYNQTGIGDGRGAPLFNGAAGYVNIATASLHTAFNGAEGALILWAKPADASVWTTETFMHLLNLRIDASNKIEIYKNGIAGFTDYIEFYYNAGGVQEAYAILGMSGTGWFTLGMSWSKAGEYVKYYKDGSPLETDVTLGTFNKGSAWANAIIAAQGTTPTQLWNGYMAHVAIFTTPLNDSAMANLASV